MRIDLPADDRDIDQLTAALTATITKGDGPWTGWSISCTDDDENTAEWTVELFASLRDDFVIPGGDVTMAAGELLHAGAARTGPLSIQTRQIVGTTARDTIRLALAIVEAS